MESAPENPRAGSGTDYIDVQVLPPAGKTKRVDDLDPLIKLVSRLLDTVFLIPGTRIRFGLEPIIGLIPVLGDQVTSLVSAALLYRSVQHRLPKIALVRMALNIFINAVIGMVPVIGDIFVLWYKPNIRNYTILQRYAGQASAPTGGDWLFVSVLIGSTFFLIVVVTLVIVYATLSQFRWW
ncbi:MAG: DUF4112 domain-containing protein [Verrucomicrobia bacterium]|nr:DUF4112 domain-containing protein [Verrucomicrobiota bacterium]MBV9297603.1 DUF4112 domain-containing protein [Verrucomicrobiota bacterium]